jgi:hypothetical protein
MVGGRASSKVAMVGGGTRNRERMVVEGVRNKIAMVGGGTRTGKEWLWEEEGKVAARMWEEHRTGEGSIVGRARRKRGSNSCVAMN